MPDPSDAFADFEGRGWDDVARHYAGSDVVGALTAPAAAALAEAVGAGPARRVLDVACGPGLAARAALDLGAEVVGVDLSEAMVAVAAERVPGAEFRVAPAEDLPFGPGSFDGLMCGFGLPHFADPDAVLSESSRVLRGGATLAFTTWAAPDRVPFFGIVFTAVAEHGSFEVDLPDGPDMFRFADPDEAHATLERLGLVEASVAELPLRVALDDPAQAMDLVTRATVRTRALFEAQTDEARAAVSGAVTEAVEEMRAPDGILSVPMPAVLITAVCP